MWRTISTGSGWPPVPRTRRWRCGTSRRTGSGFALLGVLYTSQIKSAHAKFLMKSTACGSNNFSLMTGARQNQFHAYCCHCSSIFGWSHISCSWKSHYGSVWKVNWAHPEFGQVERGEGGFLRGIKLSGDCDLLIWPDCCSLGGDCWREKFWRAQPLGSNSFLCQPKIFYNICWQVKKTSLVDSRTSVTDVKFGPKHLGLILATCSADGTVGDEKSLFMKTGNFTFQLWAWLLFFRWGSMRLRMSWTCLSGVPGVALMFHQHLGHFSSWNVLLIDAWTR